ncbi:MAG TPA: phage tail tube protein [Rhizomicrobium sp.]
MPTTAKRARGANAKLAFAFGDEYDTPPDEGSYWQLPFISSALGAEQALEADDTLGQGRGMNDPSDSNITNTGDVVVPVDVRNIGVWYKLFMGDPTTVALDHATGSAKLSAQPAANSTFTVNGTAFTFVAADPEGNEILIGADVDATSTAIAAALNASVVAGVAQATYAAADDTVTINYDAAGLAGNAFTLAASADAHLELSGPTLTGGTVKHTFVSEAEDLPAGFAEIQKPDVLRFGMNRQIRGGKCAIAVSPKGKLNATCSLVAKGEDLANESACGDLTNMDVLRFSQAFGEITREGVAMGQVVSASVNYDNSLDTVEVVRNDAEIEDADPGSSVASGDVVVRLSDANKDIPTGQNNPCGLTYGWTVPGTNFSLKYTIPRAFLPRVKDSITGPGGIQKTYSWQSSSPDEGHTLTVELVNDVANYNNPA